MATESSTPQPKATQPKGQPAKKSPESLVHNAMVKGDFLRAERLAQRAINEGNTSPKLKRQWIQAINRQGKQPAALNRIRKAVKAHPDDLALHQLHARLEASAGRPSYGLKLANLALRKWPKSIELKLLRLALLQELGRTKEALNRLRELRLQEPDNPSVLMATARFYNDHGHPRAALAVVEYLLIFNPDHHQARLLRLNLIQETSGHSDAELLPLLDAARNNAAFSFRNAGELLQVIKLTTDPALTPTCQEALERVSKLTHSLPETDQLALFIQAERFNLYPIAHQALSAILTNGPRLPMVASTLFNKAMETLGDHQPEQLTRRLLQHIPKSQQANLQAHFSQHLAGAQAALDTILATPKPKRNLLAARQLANLLRNASHYTLALRYLRFCRRRWPQDAVLPLQHARLLIDVGRLKEAQDILNAPIPVSQRNQALRLLMHILIETAELEEARNKLEAVRTQLHNNGLVDFYLRVLILQGEESAANKLLQETKQRGQHKSLASGHLSPTVMGNLMADLSLLQRERNALPAGQHEAALAMRYINAASPVIRQHTQHKPTLNGSSPIPRRIIQYWDKPTPPEAVTHIMASWHSVPGFDYQRFNRTEASDFLHDTFGANYAKAFRQAGNVAESSDLFRLCYLRHYGGIYIDADDRRYGTLEALLPSNADMVCFREPFDILANNVIACVPNHPAIVLASEMAVEAMLARDSETTWSKTGPAMLTRAVAHHLLSGNVTAPGQRISILPAYLLRREIQIHIALPHKKARGYWNAATHTGQFDMTPYFFTDNKS